MILSYNQKIALAAAVGLAIGLGVSLLFCKNAWISSCAPTRGTDNSLLPVPEITENFAVKETPYRAEISGDTSASALVLNDQEAGTVVEATMVTFTTPGWLSIHEVLPDGSLGNALGAARFDKGIYLGEVPLLRATTPGRTYRGVLYVDDGDRQFDLKKDKIMESVGRAIADDFQAL